MGYSGSKSARENIIQQPLETKRSCQVKRLLLFFCFNIFYLCLLVIFIEIFNSLCCSTYEESVGLLDTAKMWQLYVDTLFTLHDNPVVKPKIRVRLYDVCDRAFKVNKLTEQHVINWVELLEADALSGYPLKSILEDSVRQFPKSSRLWVKLLKTLLEGKEEVPLFCIDTGNNDEPMAEDEISTKEIPQSFWQGVKALGNTDSIPLWQAVLDHFSSISDCYETVEELYSKALAAEPPVCSHFKSRFLNWIATHKGFRAFV